MAEPTVVKEQVIWVDAQHNPCDKDQAVGGEILETLSDGTIRSTVFTLGG